MTRAQKNLLFGAGAMVLAAIAGYSFWLRSDLYKCPVQRQPVVINGGSLEPIMKAGSRAMLWNGYYACHEPQRGDIAAYKFGGLEEPVVKIVKAVPGDSWRLATSSQTGIWNIAINGMVAKNSEGVPYQVDAQGYGLLSLYARDYETLPAGTYLLLGNLATGSIDSRAFGLADKSDLLGKVLP